MKFKFLLLFSVMFLILNCSKTKTKDILKTEVNNTSFYIDLDGNDVAIKDFKGKKVLLNFWATWCTPCLKEMPSMVKAQELLKNDNYVFLYATTDDKEKINQFKQNKPYPFQYLQYTSTLDKLNIYALPATFIYDSKGNLSKRIDGATEWDSDEMINLLKSIE